MRDKILGTCDLSKTSVEVPEWGCTVHLRSMSGTDLMRIRGCKDGYDQDVMTVCLCTVDETGRRVFEDTDFAALKGKSISAINRIVRAAVALNKMRAEDVEDEKKD